MPDMNLPQMDVMIWIGGGLFLALLEFVLPGLFVVFLGLAAICVGALIHFGWIHDIVTSLITWMGLSVFFIVTLRQYAAKYFLSDEEYRYTEEDDDAVGEIVDVIETIQTGDTSGRIRFRGTDWPARSENGIIKKGGHAVIKYRDNISYVVKKHTGIK